MGADKDFWIKYEYEKLLASGPLQESMRSGPYRMTAPCLSDRDGGSQDEAAFGKEEEEEYHTQNGHSN